MSHTGVGVARDTKADHTLAPRPNAELAQIIQQVSLAAVFFDLDVGQPQVSAQGIEEEHFVPAFTDQHFGLGEWRRLLRQRHQRTSCLISVA